MKQHANGTALATEKLLKDAPQQNGNAKSEKVEEEKPTANVVVPLDGGWGWVVVIASFFCCLVVDGIVMNVGPFLKPISLEFGVSKTEVHFGVFIFSSSNRKFFNKFFHFQFQGQLC